MENEALEEVALYNMKLGETAEIKNSIVDEIEIIRVPGGWIYKFWTLNENYPGHAGGWHVDSSVFVPFNDEFQNQEESLS